MVALWEHPWANQKVATMVDRLVGRTVAVTVVRMVAWKAASLAVLKVALMVVTKVV